MDIEIELDEDLFVMIAIKAHEEDMKLNDFILKILDKYLEEEI